MDHHHIASRVIEARRKRLKTVEPEFLSEEENMLEPSTEYSCRMEIALSADFEGDVSKKNLLKKIKAEVMSSIKTGMEQVARDLQIRGTGITVNPLKVEVSILDHSNIIDGSEFSMEDDITEPDMEDVKKKRKRKR